MNLPAKADRQLTDMQQAFVDALVANGGDKTEAAIQAGYSPDSARVQAYDLLAKPHVMAALMERTMHELAGHAPKAVARLHALTEARSEYVALQAAQDILNRLGIKAPDKHDVRVAGDISVHIDLS